MTAEDNVEELIKQFTLAQGELLKGNSEPAKEMCSHRQDVTLANPTRPVVHGWEHVAAATDQAASQFRDGEYVGVEDVSKYVTPELAYIVRIERAKAKIGGQQAVSPITLRPTMIMALKTAFGGSVRSRTLRSCSTVHGGAESSPSESHLRTTGGDTLQAAAACRSEKTEPFSICLRRLTTRTLAAFTAPEPLITFECPWSTEQFTYAATHGDAGHYCTELHFIRRK